MWVLGTHGLFGVVLDFNSSRYVWICLLDICSFLFATFVDLMPLATSPRLLVPATSQIAHITMDEEELDFPMDQEALDPADVAEEHMVGFDLADGCCWLLLA